MYTGPHIIKDGLVFGYDTGYGIANNTTLTRFYKGEPGENLWDSMLNTQSLRTHTKHYWDGNRWTENSTYTHPGVSGPLGTYLGIVFKHVSGALNSSWGNNSYGYMLRDIACTNGATMTMSSWIYTSVGCNLDSIPAVIEGEAGGESTVSGFPGAYNLSNKGTWQVIAKKATSDGNTRFIPLYPRKNGVTNGSFTGFFMWALPQVTYGNNVVPPIQPSSTRSSTQSLIDLKETTDIDVSNVTFDSTGQPEFDGSNDNINFGNIAALQNLSTGAIEIVYHRDASTGTYQMIFSDAGSDFEVTYLGNTLQFYIGNSGISYAHSVTGEFFHLVGIWGTGYKKLYLNGSLVASGTNTGVDTGSRTRYVGGRGTNFPFNGKIPVTKVYSKALTTAEIKQNFNAYKNRFSI